MNTDVLPPLLFQMKCQPPRAAVEIPTALPQLQYPVVKTTKAEIKSVTAPLSSEQEKSDSIYEQLSNILSLSELEALGDPS